ncbi:MAG TPA: DUF433 domain-containing protein [Bryobacteraceae bacterium]|nr:DUF433 domain-containing protein [Bryobacteraceae bacterium]
MTATRRLIASGTRIPVDVIADVLAQVSGPEEILEGYPTQDKERIAMAPLCTRRSQ